MKKSQWNLVNDIFSLVVFTSMVSTGFIMEFILPGNQGEPRHRGGGPQQVLLGLNRHEWADVHATLSWAFIALIALHLTLHWKWIVAMLREHIGNSTQMSLWRKLLFLGLLLLLTAIISLPWLAAP